MDRVIRFYKMQGCGNDYVYINQFEQSVEDPPSLARRVSNRNYSIGSDGLILLQPAKADGDFKMTMFNADGSESEMCGNGLCCLAKLAFDLHLTRRQSLKIETKAGLRGVRLVFEDREVVGAQVKMGVPSFQASEIPCASDEDSIDHTLMIDGQKITGTAVGMGNPHFVIFSYEKIDHWVTSLGPKIEKHEFFPNGVNVEFVQILSRSAMSMRVWERGSGETLACGTGAAAAAAAGILSNRLEPKVHCHLKGGELELEWPDQSQDILMTGPAKLVFAGELYS